MLFNSLIFLIFLPLVFFGYWYVFRQKNLQNFFILIASYTFYGWWNWQCLFLILLTTVICYISGLSISKTYKKNVKKWICGISIGLNICILCYFKYFNFFSENLKLIFSQFGFQLDWFTLDILLPVGISFYTFQAISYPIDVYRGKIDATKDFIAFSAFISFFPQLVAGPIEQSTQLLPQFFRTRHFDYVNATLGMRQILWGFFKKMVIADNCAFLVNKIFDNYTACSSPELILGAFLFTFQIYGDFSGYSDIALGTARLFSFKLTRNFRFPYFSENIAEFWRRWHISLNTWFINYIYIPLGGSRESRLKTIRNIMIVFLLSGLWHGANWTFVIWGTYHGLLVSGHTLISGNRNSLTAPVRSTRSWWKKSMSILLTFCCVAFGWIIFRSPDIMAAIHYVSLCFSEFDTSNTFIIHEYELLMAYTSIMIIIMMAFEWTQRNNLFGLQIVEGKPLILRWSTYLSICLFIIIFSGQQTDFIYFQF